MRTLLLILLSMLVALGFAQSYSVETEGGPVDLSEELAEAAAAWNGAVEASDLQESPEAETEFTFADPELLGPDVVSATIVHEDEEGFDVWVNAGLIEEFPQALLHELGLLLGLPSSVEAGVMTPVLSAETPEAPTEADIEALAAALARAGGDLDGDGDVDIFDLAVLGRAYGERGVNLSADLDGNGVVDGDDVAVMRETYTFTEPEPLEEEVAEPAGDATQPVDGAAQPGADEAPEDEGDTAEPAGEDPTTADPDSPNDAPADGEPEDQASEN